MSACLHPLRDISLRGVTNRQSAYLGVSVCWIVIAGVHLLASGASPWLPGEVWLPALISALGLAVYYYGTLAALGRGHVSIYYPIIRSSPLMIVTLNWALFSQTYSALALFGVVLIIASGFLLQKPATGGCWDDRTTLAIALIAMTASAVYTLADAVAMRYVAPETLLLWVYVLVSALLALAGLVDPSAKTPTVGPASLLFESWRLAPLPILFASITSYASYYLILMALQLRADPAYVGAVRQASIPVSVILAALILREPRALHRLGWAALLALGIAILAMQ